MDKVDVVESDMVVDAWAVEDDGDEWDGVVTRTFVVIGIAVDAAEDISGERK